MTVKELIKHLKTFEQEEEIYLSNDSEGNDIKTIHEIAKTQLGDFKKCKKGIKGAEQFGEKDEYYKWVPTISPIVIYPTDKSINN